MIAGPLTIRLLAVTPALAVTAPFTSSAVAGLFLLMPTPPLARIKN